MALVIEESTTTRIRVLTLNLWGVREPWSRRRDLLTSELRAIDADIVMLQESIVRSDYDQVAELLGSGFEIVHGTAREGDGQGVSMACRWPVSDVAEIDLGVTSRTTDACTALVAHVAAPEPFGEIVAVNHFPDWQLDHEHERELQAVATARHVERLVRDGGPHVIVAGDFDASPEAASLRFWTGRQSLEQTSVCYRDAWESVHPGEPGHTFTPTNPLMGAANWDWPYRRIDYILVRCGRHGGPTLAVADCSIAFGRRDGEVCASDHFGLIADLTLP